MVRCLKCLHYDVCDNDRQEKEYLYEDCSNFLNDAEVVPRAEVDRLCSILDSYALQYGTVKSQQKVIDRVKRETMEEIVAELAKAGIREYLYPIIAEIKKKYKEGE